MDQTLTPLALQRRIDGLIVDYMGEARRTEGNLVASLLPAVLALSQILPSDNNPVKIAIAAGIIGFSGMYVLLFYRDLIFMHRREKACRNARALVDSIKVAKFSTNFSSLAASDIKTSGVTLAGIEQAVDALNATALLPTAVKPVFKPIVAFLVAAIIAIFAYQLASTGG